LVAVAAVAACSLASVVFSSLSREAPFLFFIPAVLIALEVGGFRAALLSSVLSALAIDYFLLPPYWSLDFNPRDLAKNGFFIATTGVAAWSLNRRRIRSESSLQFQHKLLEAAVESILISDAQHHIVYWNRGAERFYGWTESEVIGKLPGTLLETSYPEPLDNIRRELNESGRWQGRLIRKCKDGSSVVTESSWALDKETGYILQTGLDITEHSRAESELKRVNQALNALSRVNQALIHSSTRDQLLQQAVEIVVQEGGYPLAWIGYPDDDAARTIKVGASSGKATETLSEIQLTWADQPSGRGPCGQALREGRLCVTHNFLSAPETAPWRERAEKYGLRSAVSLPLVVEGTTHAALTVYASEENAFKDRETNLMSELAADLAFGLTTILHREQAEEQSRSRLLLEEQFRQSQKMEAIGRLAGGISHDFNNLLMVIMAQTELLSLEVTGPALARAESVMKSAERAAELTRQLLAFSRKQIVQPKILSMNTVVEDIANMAGHLVGEYIEIVTTFCDQPWLLKIDRSQIEQVVMNLIVNARDAMPNGGKLTLATTNAEITTEFIASHPLLPAGRYVMLTVSDTGVGMTADTQARLFEPFFTTKEPSKGTGLGLSMVYGIVKQSNGFISYESELGKGSCFQIYLPVAEMQKSIDDSGAVSDSAPALYRTTILLVEDESALREVIAEFLRSAGHTVIAAESYGEAMLCASERGSVIHLLLTDVMLKGQNGRQLAESLREKGYQCKVIYMSGYTPDTILHDGVLEPETMFLQKPFTRSVLLSKVQEALLR
jgi:PAS domain S-box-containing protein